MWVLGQIRYFAIIDEILHEKYADLRNIFLNEVWAGKPLKNYEISYHWYDTGDYEGNWQKGSKVGRNLRHGQFVPKFRSGGPTNRSLTVPHCITKHGYSTKTINVSWSKWGCMYLLYFCFPAIVC